MSSKEGEEATRILNTTHAAHNGAIKTLLMSANTTSKATVDACYCEDASQYLAALDDCLQDKSSKNSVTSVDLSGNKIDATACTDVSWKYLAAFRNLTSLDIKANRIGPDGWNALYETLSANCPLLEYLDMSENGLLDESLYNIARMLVDMRNLKHLSLVTNALSPRGLPTLCDGLRGGAHALTHLMLDYNMLGDQGCVMVCEAVGLGVPTLQRIGLSDNNIGNAGAKAVARYLIEMPSCNITWINLSCNKIGDDGLFAIGNALTHSRSNTRLRNLDVSCNPEVTVAGAAAFLATAERWVSLRAIELCSMSLTNDHCALLIKAIDAPTSSLRYVEYFNNPAVSVDAEGALCSAMETSEKYANEEEEEDKTDNSGALGNAWRKAAVCSVLVLLATVGVFVLRRVTKRR